jgi:non-specific serine/threonine protein kinase
LGVAECLEARAAMAIEATEPERAARLLGAAEAIRREIGAPVPPVERPDHEDLILTAKAALGATNFAHAWASGQALTLDQAVAEGLGEAATRMPGDAAQQPGAADAPSPLTERESEVAALVARGLTNRQIGAELSISARTVDRHVANILNRLGLDARTQVAAWVVERQLAGR